MTRKIIYSSDELEPVGPYNQAVLEFSSILKMTVFPTDLPCFSTVNKVFSDQFKGIEPPARSVVEVSGLPMNADIEIECIASV